MPLLQSRMRKKCPLLITAASRPQTPIRTTPHTGATALRVQTRVAREVKIDPPAREKPMPPRRVGVWPTERGRDRDSQYTSLRPITRWRVPLHPRTAASHTGLAAAEVTPKVAPVAAATPCDKMALRRPAPAPRWTISTSKKSWAGVPTVSCTWPDPASTISCTCSRKSM